MKVTDLIIKLSAFASESPENGSAEILLQHFDGMCYGILGANNCKGIERGQHALVVVPDGNFVVDLRQLKVQ